MSCISLLDAEQFYGKISRRICGIRLLRMYEYVVFVSRHTYVYAWLLRKVTCVCVVINYD